MDSSTSSSAGPTCDSCKESMSNKITEPARAWWDWTKDRPGAMWNWAKARPGAMWDWIKSKFPGGGGGGECGGGGCRLLYSGQKTGGSDTAAKKATVTFEPELVLLAAGASAVGVCLAASVWAFRWARRPASQLHQSSAYSTASCMESRGDGALLD